MIWKGDNVKRPSLGLIALLILALPTLVLVAACAPGAGSGPSSWIDLPLDGDQVAMEPLTIEAHASDLDGVSRVEFLVENTSLGTVPTDGSRFVEAKAGWSPPAPGTYVVNVISVDVRGNRGSAASARVVVVGSLATQTPTIPSLAPLPITETPGQTLPVITAIPGPVTEIPSPVVVTVTPLPATVGIGTLAPVIASETPTLTPLPTWTPTTISTSAPVCPGAPAIESFTAQPATIAAGQSTMLHWGAVTNANSAEIDPDIGGVPTPGSVSVSPGQTTTYTLTATGCGGTTRKQVTVVVKTPSPTPRPPTRTPAPPTPDTNPPTISGPSANPLKIWVVSGGCAGKPRSTNVTAQVTDPSGVQSVVARWYFNGARNDTTMSPAGGNGYQAAIGGFNSSGTISIYVVATDNNNNVGQAGPATVTVAPCIE
jgi:hypothetical protein